MPAAQTVGTLFFLGGCAAAFTLPAPAWFNTVDLIPAYAPPTLAGYLLAAGIASIPSRSG